MPFALMTLALWLMHSTTTRPFQEERLGTAQIEAATKLSDQSYHLSNYLALSPETRHFTQLESDSSFHPPTHTTDFTLPSTYDGSKRLGQAEISDVIQPCKKQKTLDDTQLIPNSGALLTFSEFNKIVSDPKFDEPWKNTPTQNDWPLQHSADIQHKASWLEHTPKNSADSTSTFLPSHVPESPFLSPPIQNPQDILPSETYPHFSTEPLFNLPNSQTPHIVPSFLFSPQIPKPLLPNPSKQQPLKHSPREAHSHFLSEPRSVLPHPQIPHSVSLRFPKYAGGRIALPPISTLQIQFSNLARPAQSSDGLLEQLTSGKPIKITHNVIWPPPNSDLETPVDSLPPFMPWQIWIGDELYVPHFKKHDTFIGDAIEKLESRNAAIWRGRKTSSFICKTLQVQYSILKAKKKDPQIDETGFIQLLSASQGIKTLQQISEKLIVILRRTLFYYAISESIIFGNQSTRDVLEISKWLMAQLFDPQKGLPVFGKTQKKLSKLDTSDFGITQKIFLLTFANSSPGSIETGALSLVAAWYKAERQMLWKKFQSDTKFLEIMASYLRMKWPEKLMRDFPEAQPRNIFLEKTKDFKLAINQLCRIYNIHLCLFKMRKTTRSSLDRGKF
ncbi:hypothetical protein O181_013046 [Austropuccinia psidii MF-1]|uniref:Uncharacterized protein n=1 Tax=Austropuccinia psidii MF-1 TaxID=1389203 RepID=A0A9Q3BYY0_9BASI|nr:hypothetical protein [Austropuccinia psidii MF-1]